MTVPPAPDLIVAGGGPAGLATALHARRHGLEVLVREPREGPIDKACGEGLMPGALAALRDLGVDPPGCDLRGIRYVAGPRSVEAPFRRGHGRGVRRTALHEVMREAALAAGARLEAARVREVRQEGGGVRVDGTAAGYLVAADGLHSPLRRRLGLEGRPASLRRFGLRRHYASPPWTAYVEVHWSDLGEAYVTPVGPGLVGVALLTATQGPFDRQLAAFPELRDRLEGRPAVGSDRGAGPLRQRATARVHGRVLLVGDAAGYVDALTGEGVALAMAQAREAVAAIVAGDPDRYERGWHTATRRYRMLTASLVGATRAAPVRCRPVPDAERLPHVFAAAVNTLAGPA
jgi:flavin-dependent dehydrogenase